MSYEIVSSRDSSKHDRANDSAASSLFEDAYKDSLKGASAMGRVAMLTASGTVCGALAEVCNDPPGALHRAGDMAVGAMGLGAVAMFSPGFAAAGSAAGMGYWAWNNLNPYDETNRQRYSKIGDSIRQTWLSDDAASFKRNFEAIKECTGPIALDVGLMALSPRIVTFGAKHAIHHAERLAPKLCPKEPLLIPAFATGHSTADIAFFQTRNGKVRTSKGPVETIEARLAELDRNLVVNRTNKEVAGKGNDHHNFNDLSEISMPPLDWDKITRNLSKAFWSSEKREIYFLP